MKITFLGTSHGIPEPNRRCSCTMIETAGRYYFVDMGIMPTQDLAARNIPMDAVKGIFITHLHGDHTNGLISLLDQISWYPSYRACDPAICLPDLCAAEAAKQWIRINGVILRELRFSQITEGVIFDDGFLKVTAVATAHHVPSYAFLAEAEGKSILFTGDLKHPTVDFPRIAAEQETDLIIAEGSHFPVTEYTDVLKQCPTKTVCIHHYTQRNITCTLDLAKELTPVPVQLASDGMEITL